MDKIIRLLRNGEFAYVSAETLRSSNECEVFIDRDDLCTASRNETHYIMVKRAGDVLNATASDIEKATCAEVSWESLIAGDYIQVIAVDKYITKGFEPT